MRKPPSHHLSLMQGLRSEACELKNRLSSKKRQLFSAPEVKLLILSVMLVVIGVVILGRFSYILATQSQYAQQLSEYSTCQLRGNRPDCIAETTITSVSIVARILTVVAIAAVPYVNMIFLVGKSDFFKIANLLCHMYKLIWSCHSARMDGELSHEAMGNFPGG